MEKRKIREDGIGFMIVKPLSDYDKGKWNDGKDGFATFGKRKKGIRNLVSFLEVNYQRKEFKIICSPSIMSKIGDYYFELKEKNEEVIDIPTQFKILD